MTDQTTGNSQTIDLDGTQYTLRPRRFSYQEMEAFVVSQRADPLDAAVEAVGKTPAAFHPGIWDAAMRAVINNRSVATIQEMTDFESSIRGYAWKLWQAVKGDHPEIDSLEKAMELLERIGPAGAAELESKLHQVTETNNRQETPWPSN